MTTYRDETDRTPTVCDRIRVDIGVRGYEVVVQDGLLDHIGEFLVPFKLGPETVVVTNPVVKRHYGTRVVHSMRAVGLKPAVLTLPDGERTKSLRRVARVLEELLRRRYERKAWLVALGGGVIGDLAGFAASIYLRGVPFVQVPTTLVAQVDASIGGKTGVNHLLGKNLIGTFYQPKLVLIDPGALRTLPTREYRSGLAEVIKYGVIEDAEFFEFLERDMDSIMKLEPTALHRVIRTSCAIKAAVVSEDEREGDRRRILNFGHTVGHALETLGGYRQYKHGEAVAIGMVVAARLAERLGLADASVGTRIRALVERTRLPADLPPYSTSALIRAMRQDKKVQDRRIHFVLPDRIGHVVVRPVEEPEIQRALAACQPST
ncbi:MAG TPA: 3-dehydroquinate synthase [Nitrospirales bacterium]|nr:3-dehydroquinate synthase [Nitrospirales bacterium]